MDNQRLFLFVALALILGLIWQAWDKQYAPAPITVMAGATAGKTADVPTAPGTPPTSKAGSAAGKLIHGDRIEVVTDLFQADVDLDGGDLRQLRLRRYPVAANTPDVAFPLMREEGEVFIAQSGLLGHAGDLPNHKTHFAAAQKRYELGSQDELRIPLTYKSPDGVSYTKTYIFRRGSYTIDVEFNVANGSKKEWSGYFYGQFQHSRVEKPGMFAVSTYTGAAIYTPTEKYEKISFEDMAKKPLKRDTTDGWVAMLQHYFVGAWLPTKEERIEFYSDAIEGDRYAVGYKQLAPTAIAAGQTGALRSTLYAGPKEQHRLEQLACVATDLSKTDCTDADRVHAPGMQLTVDYGALTFLAAPLFRLLGWIYRVLGNWGWSIIVLTILVKLAFYPLSAMSYKSMAQMRKVQPKLESIRQQHANDRQALNQAMMELYKTEKINPMGGCLPILIQIPVFIALYWVLLESIEMRQTPWILWIKDLSSQDPYYVLPLIMGATMYLQQFLSPQPPDPVQRKVFMIMPVVFTGMFVFFPAGLVLYWTVNNLLSITQQWYVNNSITTRKAKTA